MKYEVEFARYTKVIIEAEDKEEAELIASMMDHEDIEKHDPHEYEIFDIREIGEGHHEKKDSI